MYLYMCSSNYKTFKKYQIILIKNNIDKQIL